jgi:alkyl hydroperoxide reductase subunit AhpC
MKELGELEKNAGEFEKRNVRLVVASLEDMETAKLTQSDFPHLVVVSDPEQRLTSAFQVLHEGVYTPDEKPANAPTTFLIDGGGTVRWLFRPDRHLDRLSPQELLSAVDSHLVAK